MTNPLRANLLPLAALTAAAALLARFPSSPYYPPCLFHQVTGLLCPGCGATRALASLLHGHLNTALHQNALIVLFLPAVLLYAVLLALQCNRLEVPVPILATAGCITVLFTVARNLA